MPGAHEASPGTLQELVLRICRSPFCNPTTMENISAKTRAVKQAGGIFHRQAGPEGSGLDSACTGRPEDGTRWGIFHSTHRE